MSYLHYLCLLVDSDAFLFCFVLCLACPLLPFCWIVLFLIVPSVFSNDWYFYMVKLCLQAHAYHLCVYIDIFNLDALIVPT
jgi:hypothetical protein